MYEKDKLLTILADIEGRNPKITSKYNGFELLILKYSVMGLLGQPDRTIEQIENENKEWKIKGGEQVYYDANEKVITYLRDNLQPVDK